MGRRRAPFRRLGKCWEGVRSRSTGWTAAAVIILWPAAGFQLPALFTTHRTLWAVGLTAAFAVCARVLRAVTPGGAVTGFLLAFLLFLGGGPGAFAALVTVFLLAAITTRLGYGRKRSLGTAERPSGRSASQILANVAIAGAAAMLAAGSQQPAAWLVACAAALAEAAADTVSSEFGQAASETAYLITDFRPVPVGTDGGISLPGTIAGMAAAVVIALVCRGAKMIEPHWLFPVAGAGVLGMFVDSFLGALLERRRVLSNDAVNFLSTIVAALFALFLYWSRQGKFPLP